MNDNESILSKTTFELDDIIVNSRVYRQTMRKHQMAMKPIREPEVQQPALKMKRVLPNLSGPSREPQLRTSDKLSKSAKEVPDSAMLKGDLDHVRTVAEQEEPESEPKADVIRSAAAIIRHMSTARLNLEAAEAWRRDDGLRDRTEPISEKEQDEWAGLLPLGMTISPPRPITTTSHPHPSNPHDDDFVNPFNRHEQPAEGSLPTCTGTVHATQPLSRKRPYLPLRPLTELIRPPSYIPIPVEDSVSDGSPVNWYGLR